jgi:hypothetical protein
LGNLSEYVLTETEESVLKRGLNFADLDLVCAAGSARSKLLPALGMEFCWKIRRLLDKSKPLTSNIARKESLALKSLKHNKEIRILQADKGNSTVVLNGSAYKENISNHFNQEFRYT